LIVCANGLSLHKRGSTATWPPPAKEGQSRTFYVDINQAKSGNGKSKEEAFQSIQECVNQLEIAGDKCLLLPGHYHEEVQINGKFASEEKPFVIEGFEDSRPTLDGTTEIKGKFLDDDNNLVWKQLEDGNCKKYPIYYTPYDQKVWQLFVDGEMMTNARWPNARWSDKSVFDASLWGKSTRETTEKRLYDRNRKLSKSWIDATGAIAVLNIGSWDTFVSKVLAHKRGQDWFDFNNTWGHMEHLKPEHGQYFLEAKLDFLDSEEEWFIDEKYIYVWAPEGKNPTNSKVMGKTSSFAFSIANSSNIVFRNMDFFATAIKTLPHSKRASLVGNLKFENLNFQYPSYSRRILGEAKKPECMNINADARVVNEIGDLTFLNCTWYGSDGVPMRFSGNNVILRNNLWELNDWSGANNDFSSSGGIGTIMSGKSRNETFIRNTLLNNGASAAYRPNKYTLAKLNEISGQCWGLGQNDGSGIQVMIASQNARSVITQNWVHDQPKLGIRFDCPNGGSDWHHLGRGATISENVVWNAGGIMAKGDNHTVIKNLAFSPKYCVTTQGKLKPHINVPHWIGTNPIPFNNFTHVELNIADFSNGGVSRITKKRIPMSGSRVEGNFPQPWDGCDDVVASLVDFNNRDFRPKFDTAYAKAGAGPYAAGVGDEYWIPGRQLMKATKPIPADNGHISVNRDALIFLQGFDADSHDVYFAESYGQVQRRSPKTFLKTLEGDSNMCALPKNLRPGKKYFWAVDAKGEHGTVKGDVWTFSIEDHES